MDNKIQTLTGCALLLKKEVDWDIFRLQFFDDWKVEVGGESTPTLLSFAINGAHVLCLLCDSKVDLAIENAERNYSWRGAREEIEKHTAHVQIYIMDCENDLQRHVLFSMIASSMLKQRYMIGLYQYPVTREANDYIEEAQRMLKDDLPVLSWVYIGLYQDEDGLWNSYTYGMEEFHKNEIEILHTEKNLMELYTFMAQIVSYLIANGETLKPGESVGTDGVHHYKVTKSSAYALGGESMKIDF